MESLLEEEFKPHFEAWRANETPQTTAVFLKSINPVLDSAVKTYGGSRPSPTVHSKAKLIAVNAARGYDPSQAKLRTHLMVHLQGLRRTSARENQIIRIPERVGLDMYRLHEAETELRDRLGREPSTAELADHTSLSMKRIGHVRKAHYGVAEGSMVSQSEEGGPVQFSPAVGGGSDKTWLDFVYHDLHPTDQYILEHTVGLHGRKIMPKQEIARRLGITPGAVSQRAARIQSVVDQRDELGSYL